MNIDQLHRATLGIYSSLMDHFNPSLQKLVSLGNSYIQAFQALATTSEAYFNALADIGQQTTQTTSSQIIGDVLAQIAETQRRLTKEIEGIFRWFHSEVVQEMDNNIRMDKDYISGSRRRYEMEVRSHAGALERQLRRADQDGYEYVQFLQQSHDEALKEEERRYRFLAEKHCHLSQTVGLLMNKTAGALQQRAEAWKEELNATRGAERRLDLMELEGKEWDREEQPLGRVPSRAPSPQMSRSRSSSGAESLGGNMGSVGGGRGGGGRGRGVGGRGGGECTRALVAHQPDSSNPTLLPFSRGELVTVLVRQPKNGWLYGQTETRQGWFPAVYVEPVKPTSSSDSTLRRGGSVSNLLDQSAGGSQAGASPPPPPPPPPALYRQPAPASNRRPEPVYNNNRPGGHNTPHELFPKGTNPFATVKLKPTSTNDKSAPRLHR